MTVAQLESEYGANYPRKRTSSSTTPDSPSKKRTKKVLPKTDFLDESEGFIRDVSKIAPDVVFTTPSRPTALSRSTPLSTKKLQLDNIITSGETHTKTNENDADDFSTEVDLGKERVSIRYDNYVCFKSGSIICFNSYVPQLV